MANMAQALRMALHYAEENLNLKDVFGQDVGPPLGGVFTATQGLKTSWNTPLDERGIIGTAIGCALTGRRCVAEIQFADYIFNSIDLLKQAGMVHWISSGRYSLPLVVMTPNGAGIHGAIYHSHSFDSWALRLPGWKIISPSHPLDAYGLMLSAIEDPNPVLYLIPKALLRVSGNDKIPGEFFDEKELKSKIDAPVGDRKNFQPQWPPLEKYLTPLGKAQCVQKGDDLTVVSFGRSLYLCRQAISQIHSASIELIDLRSLYPYDWKCIKQSIQKTKKVLFVNEDTEVVNFAEHLAYRTVQECFYELHAPPRVLAGKNVPGIGLHPHYENNTVPRVSQIIEEIQQLLLEKP